MVEITINKAFKEKLSMRLLEDLACLVDSFVYQIKDYKNIQKRVFGDYEFHKVTGIYVDVTFNESEGNLRTIQVLGENTSGEGIAIHLKLNTKEGIIRVIFLNDRIRVEESLGKSLAYTDRYMRGIDSFVETFLGYYNLKSYDMSNISVDCLFEDGEFKYYLNYYLKEDTSLVYEEIGVLE